MKKIMFICNYTPWEKIQKGIMPSQHLFGIQQLIERYSEDGQKALLKSELGGGYVDFYYSNGGLKDACRYYLISFKYDVVYDVLSVMTKYFSVLNKLHLFLPKLINIYHHPPFNKILKYGKADVSIFYTERLLLKAKELVNDNRVMTHIEWYPDNFWYDSHSTGNENKTVDFLDNGKTGRDHVLFMEAVTMLNRTGLIVCTKEQEKKMNKKLNGVDFFCQEKPNDLAILSLCKKSKIMVIPLLNDDELIGPSGITSYADAIAMGMPVVCSENAIFIQEILENKTGVSYKSKDIKSLVEAMKKCLDNYNFYHMNMLDFKHSHDIKLYSRAVKKLID